MRFSGYRFDVSVYAYYKVAIAKIEDKDDIEDQAFLATDRLFDNWSEIEVVDTQVMEINQDNKYFTVVDVGLELRVTVTAQDHDDAYCEAEGLVRENTDLPGGVAFFECEAFDSERDTEECWID